MSASDYFENGRLMLYVLIGASAALGLLGISVVAVLWRLGSIIREAAKR